MVEMIIPNKINWKIIPKYVLKRKEKKRKGEEKVSEEPKKIDQYKCDKKRLTNKM